jgi:hypothetical protein
MRDLIGARGYDDFAQQHRPQSRAALGAACRELHGRGLMPRDIAMHLRMDLGDVIDLLRERRQ